LLESTVSADDDDTPDHVTTTRFGAAGILVSLLVRHTRRTSEIKSVSSVTEECDITSVSRVGIPMLAKRLQLFISNIVIDEYTDGMEDTFVDETFSVERPLLYVVGI
jgi:hypothetical protein